MSDQQGPQNPSGRNPGDPGPGTQPGWQPQAGPSGPPPGYQPPAQPPQGYLPPGYQQPGYQQPGQPPQGYLPPGYQQPGQPPQGHPQSGDSQQPVYGQPPYGQPPYGQPPYGQPPYGQPASWPPPADYGQQYPAAQPPTGVPSGGSAKRRRTPMVITAVAVVVALLAGTGIWYFGFRETKSASGQSSPQEAASSMLLSLSQKDPIGVADQLDPAEASLFADLNGEFLTELKRLEILSPSASTTSLSGSKITVTGLTFGSDPDQINNHVTVVKLTGGTVTVSTDLSQLPLTDKIKAAAGSSLDQLKTQTRTYNIADEARKAGHPIRIATVNRDGKWYPSMFYTAADYWAQAAKVGNPTAADYIAGAGGTSPQDTMDRLLTAATKADYNTLIALLPPQEMGVMHDYGKLIIGKIPAADTSRLTSTVTPVATWNVSDVAGGKLVSLKTLTVTTSGQTISVVRDAAAGSLTVTVTGQPAVVLNKDTIGSYIDKSLGNSSSGMDPQLVKIIGQEFQQLIGIGMVMTQDPTDSKWYASPMRSYAEIFVSLLKGLQPGDVDYLIALAKK